MVQRTKNYFSVNRGLNTESSEIAFPDGYSPDMSNYELLVDGSMRRRRGLQQESNGADLDSGRTHFLTPAVVSYNWQSVAGDPDKNLIAVQIGEFVYFCDDNVSDPSNTWYSDTIDLTDYLVKGTTGASTVALDECEFAQGRGKLIITQKHIEPIYVDWDTSGDTFRVRRLQILHRDFDGIEDGVGNQVQPTTLEEEHEYNLRNRGWKAADIANGSTGYFDVQSAYPAKNMLWFKGYRRATAAGFADIDGIQQFDSNKLAAEQFGTSSAPQGSLLLDPLDTRYSASNANEGPEVLISNWVFTSGDPKAGGTVRVTATGHGRSTNDYVTISGNSYLTGGSVAKGVWATLNGYWQVTVIDANTFDFTYPANKGKSNILIKDPTAALGSLGVRWGQVNGNVSLPRVNGEDLDYGPTNVAFHAGRIFYAGIESTDYADTVFFSQVAIDPLNFGKCYQENDPTNPEVNELQDNDGGTIVIPNLGSVKKMLTMRNSLLLFTDLGVWEIGGGERGVFTATGYSVRKITESPCLSQRSAITVDNQIFYAGPEGIHRIAPNQYTGLLEEQNISDDLIRTLWQTIRSSALRKIFMQYDNLANRIFIYYSPDASSREENFANALILDLRVGAYYKYTFDAPTDVAVVGGLTVSVTPSSGSTEKLKPIYMDANGFIGNTTFVICDYNTDDYLDYAGNESPLPYFFTGWDNIGDMQRRRKAPVVTVYAKRTETGYLDVGGSFDPINLSSNLMTAYWDWTDDNVSGKIGTQQETYRDVRNFTPASVNDVNGYPVVVTRNKVRGRGRVLQLKFEGAAGYDSHILGFTVNYDIKDRI